MRKAKEGSLPRYRWGALFGALATVPALLSVGLHSRHQWLNALLWCGVFLMAGALLGFLFGVSNTAGRPVDSESSSTANANLESISDWITKMLVGIMLINLTRIPGQLHRLSAFVAGGLYETADEPFVLALIIYFSGIGFLIGSIATHFYFRLLTTKEGAEAIQSLSRSMEATVSRQIMNALRAPTMVNYEGVFCLRVSDQRGALDAEGTQIRLREELGSIFLEAWLQPQEPSESGVSFAPVSITGGEQREEAEFEFRLDSDLFQPDHTYEMISVHGRARTQKVEFRAHFDLMERRGEVPYERSGDTASDSYPRKHPLWLMLFQQNRLVQTISLSFTLGY